MREWIFDDGKSTTLLLDKVTVLKGSANQWKSIIHLLKDTINHNKYTLHEGNEKINCKDYQLNILSYSSTFNSEDMKNNKGSIMDSFFSYLELSPFYKQLVESWDELQEEIYFLNEELGYEDKITLSDFKKQLIKKNLKIESDKNDSFLQLKQQLRITRKLNSSKRNIFLIINPELELNLFELEQLDKFMNLQTDYFIVITSHVFRGSVNVIHDEKLINSCSLLKYKSKIEDLLPFVFKEDTYNDAVNWYIELVDKYDKKTINLSLPSVDKLETFIYLYLLFYLSDISFSVDYSGIPPEYQSYIDSLQDIRL